MTTPSDDSKKVGSGFHLSYNRSGLGCLLLIIVVIVGTPLSFFLFYRLAPTDTILRFELNFQNYRGAHDTIQHAGPSAVPILKEYMSDENTGTRITAVRVAGDFIFFHPKESQPLVSALCQYALQDANQHLKINATRALRDANFPSDEIDQTLLQLMKDKNNEIRLVAENTAIRRIVFGNVQSRILCEARDQLKPYLDRAESDFCSAKALRAFLDICEGKELTNQN